MPLLIKSQRLLLICAPISELPSTLSSTCKLVQTVSAESKFHSYFTKGRINPYHIGVVKYSSVEGKENMDTYNQNQRCQTVLISLYTSMQECELSRIFI